MIELESVSKVYPGTERSAVDGIDLKVNEGEICVMVGTSGCGKTTTMKMINRLIEPTGGIIRINGEDAMKKDANELRRDIGYVIQKIGLFPHHTIRDNIATVPKLKGWDKARIDKRVSELLDMVGLDEKEYAHKYPSQLSGGQNQRVGLARAMATDPPIMLMDEPFGAVDPITRTSLQDEFLKLQKNIRKTICFVTHDIEEAIKMGDRVVLMHQGKIMQNDTPENLLMHPNSTFVENFVGKDRALKVLQILYTEQVVEKGVNPVWHDELDKETLAVSDRWDHTIPVVHRDTKKIMGFIAREIAEQSGIARTSRVTEMSFKIRTTSTFKETITALLQFGEMVTPVLDENDCYIGLADFDSIRSYVGSSCTLPEVK